MKQTGAANPVALCVHKEETWTFEGWGGVLLGWGREPDRMIDKTPKGESKREGKTHPLQVPPPPQIPQILVKHSNFQEKSLPDELTASGRFCRFSGFFLGFGGGLAGWVVIEKNMGVWADVVMMMIDQVRFSLLF